MSINSIETPKPATVCTMSHSFAYSRIIVNSQSFGSGNCSDAIIRQAVFNIKSSFYKKTSLIRRTLNWGTLKFSTKNKAKNWKILQKVNRKSPKTASTYYKEKTSKFHEEKINYQ